MNKKTAIILITALCLSVVTNISLVFLYRKTVFSLQKCNEIAQYNAKLTTFRNLFTKNIILSDQAVGFEERMKMEEAARNLDDQGIYSLWQAFSKSKTSEEVGLRAKKLLEALIDKTSY